MTKPQSVPCPVCRTPIVFDITRLLQGERFRCPQCSATIFITNESRPVIQNAMDKLNKIKQGND